MWVERLICKRVFTFCRYYYASVFSNAYCTSTASETKLPNILKEKIANGPSLHQFLKYSADFKTDELVEVATIPPYVAQNNSGNQNRKVFIETFGCQMNVNDTEIIRAILQKAGYLMTEDINDAKIILVMTCAIREGAEQKVWNKVEFYKRLKKKKDAISQEPVKIGILGCMAERLKHKLIEKEKMVDIVAGPDSYRDLPNLLCLADEGQNAVNVVLSMDETYADITPVRINPLLKSAFVSIMRGCDNICAYCIVPFTRGRERSRSLTSILDEVKHLSEQGYKEITLLGQNVNSYRDISESSHSFIKLSGKANSLSKGFRTIYKPRSGGLFFADLLDKVSDVDHNMRIRFTSPHPKDFPDEVLHLINEKPNICKLLHLPAQSGNTDMLQRMKRGYSREAYLELVEHVHNIIPNIAFTSDFIAGFCGETEEEHQDTLSLVEQVKYKFAFVFPYSMREKTKAHHRMIDDVPTEVKKRRVAEILAVFRQEVFKLHKKEIGKEHLVLVSGPSKRSEEDWCGRNDWNTKVIFPCEGIPSSNGSKVLRHPTPGDYVVVKIHDCTSQVLKGTALYYTTLTEFIKHPKEFSVQNFAACS